jgi:hypothetical protein
MPKKEHVGYTRLSKKQLDNYVKGKSFTVKPVDDENEDNTVVKLHFKAKKNLSKLNKNLSMGKGVRVHPHEIDDMSVHTGNGIFDSMKGVMNSKLTKGIVKAALPTVASLAAQQVKNISGSDAASSITKSLINETGKELTGSGFRSKRGGSFLPLGGSINANNQYLGIGPNVPSFSNPSGRMAYVRSHRKSNGVVMQ